MPDDGDISDVKLFVTMVGIAIVLAGGFVYIAGHCIDANKSTPLNTTHDILFIDTQTFVFIDDANQTRVINWVRHGGSVKVVSSTDTYVVVIPHRSPLIGNQYELHLNVSDLK